MRVLPLVFVLLILVHPRAHPASLNITPNKSFYLRGDVIRISGKLQAGAVPVANEEVYLLINGSVVDSTNTDSEGNFEFDYQIPLNRPPGTYMNVTVYFPGSYLLYPTYANATILIYGSVYVEARFSTGGESLEKHFEGSESIGYRFSATFDNGTPAPIDRYVAYSYEGNSGTHSDHRTFNDTFGDSPSINVEEPSQGKIVIKAYCDEEGFLFKNNLKREFEKDLTFVLYEYANVTAYVDSTFVDKPAYLYVHVVDELGYTSVLASALENGEVYITYGDSRVEPVNEEVNAMPGYVYGSYEFSLPPSRGGELTPHVSLKLPGYVRVLRADLKADYVELRNVTIVFPSGYPNGVPITFTPYVYNELTGESRLLKPFVQSLQVLYGNVRLLRRNGSDLILYASGDVGFFVNASANNTQMCFRAYQEITMSGSDVHISSNASGSIRIRPDGKFSIYIRITPREFEGVYAIASLNVTDDVGTRTKKITFAGSVVLTFYGNQLSNNTMINISIGDRNATLIVFIQKVGSTTPAPPTPPSNQATGQSRIAILAIVLFAVLIILVLYLLYLIIKMIKGRLGKKKAKPLTGYEALIQNLRRIYRTGNYKLLATEAYKFLVSTLAPRLGVTIRPNDTPRKVAEKIISAGASASAVMTIVNAYEIAKYSPRDIDDETAQKIISAVSTLIKEHLQRPVTAAR